MYFVQCTNSRLPRMLGRVPDLQAGRLCRGQLTVSFRSPVGRADYRRPTTRPAPRGAQDDLQLMHTPGNMSESWLTCPGSGVPQPADHRESWNSFHRDPPRLPREGRLHLQQDGMEAAPDRPPQRRVLLGTAFVPNVPPSGRTEDVHSAFFSASSLSLFWAMT